MASPVDARGLTNLQLKDVYDIAQRVGEEFQNLIANFGNSHTATLVETVIAVLEHLENTVDLSNQLRMKHCQMLLDRDNLVRDQEEMKVSFCHARQIIEPHLFKMPKLLVRLLWSLENKKTKI